jgi:hypothetical protein
MSLLRNRAAEVAKEDASPGVAITVAAEVVRILF